jgi:hypothetical protein
VFHKKKAGYTGHVLRGSPRATLFITVLFLPQLTENLQYQLVIKDQAVSGEAEAMLNHIPDLPWPHT